MGKACVRERTLAFLILGSGMLAAGCAGGDTGRGENRGTTPVVVPTTAGTGGRGGSMDFGNGTPRAGSPAVVPTTPPKQTPGAAGGVLEPVLIDQCQPTNPANLSAADVEKLMAGGASGNARVVYPYDGTVFPRGLLAPLLMWDGGNSAANALYVHIKASKFEYKGCLAPSAAGQLQVPQDVWDTAGAQTQGPTDPFVVELTLLAGGTAVGPVRLQITIAQATLKGSIYYNSYSSQLATGMGLGGIPVGSGAVLRIPRGKTAEGFLGQTGCTGCHSVSANGERMVALPLIGAGFGGDASSFALTPDGAVNPPALNAALANGAFTGLSPDGTLFMTSAHGGAPPFMIVGPRAGGPGAVGGPTAGLFQTDTGAAVAGSGLAEGAMMPTFSPDGTQIAFTDLALDEGHGLAVMSFDQVMRKAGNYREIYRTGDMRYPGWPFFLPDGKAVVFANGEASDFSGMGAGIIGLGAGLGAPAPASDLYFIDLANGQPVVLAKAMGFATAEDFTAGKTYLPFGDEELHHHYYPTVAPVAAGGYFWVFFDSLRHYGNLGMQRQIWGSAIEVSADGSYKADASHPAFYLTGQEFGTGNHRAFAALDPCKKDGNSCTSGIDCCGGFCYVPEKDTEFGEPVGTCTSDIPECAKTNERCTSTADCCPPTNGERMNSCIAGFCATVHAPE